MVEERFDPPLDDLEQAAFATRTLAHRLIAGLGPWGGAPHRVVVEAESASGLVRSRTWRSADPFGEAEVAERVRWPLRAWVESGGVPGGLAVLRLAPADRSDRGRQLHLGEERRLGTGGHPCPGPGPGPGGAGGGAPGPAPGGPPPGGAGAVAPLGGAGPGARA